MGNVWLPPFPGQGFPIPSKGRVFLSHLKAEFSSLGVPPRYSQRVFSDLRKVILAPEFSLPFWIPSRHSSQTLIPFPWTSRTDQRKREASSALLPGTTPCISTVSHTGALQTAPAPLTSCPAAHPGWGPGSVCRTTSFCKKASACFPPAVTLDGRKKSNTENGKEERKKGKGGGTEEVKKKAQEKLWIWISSILSLCHLS